MRNYLNSSLCRLLLSLCLLGAFVPAWAESGLFWKAESSQSKDIYLFGTIHTDDNRVTNFSAPVTEAIKAADAFMMETLSPNNLGIFMMAEGDLRSMLTEQELEQVYALAEFHVMHRDAALHMKPWLLAVVFDSPRPLTPFAQDNLLMTQAEGAGKQVIGIEDTQEHFGIMDSFTLDEQLIMLRAV
ncbi:MAG: TraB/GumN family protein, partial [Methylotenera sp.]|nr:TraB/GumN family protein [Methylotenera sp.]